MFGPKPHMQISHRHIAAMLFNEATDGRSRGSREGDPRLSEGVGGLSPISKCQDPAGFHNIKL